MDLRLTRPRAGAGGVYMARRGTGGGRHRSLGGAAARVSPPRGRVRAVVACSVSQRVGVCEAQCGGGGEPRAARARADGRPRSAPPPRAPPAPRRARSLPAPRAPPRPRLRPVFLWARQRDGTVQEVRCEDYDSRNRIRIARTPAGWRVIPRTEIYNSIRVPPPPPREKRERRRRRRYGKSKRRRADQQPPPQQGAWLTPDLESHIPSHTIAVPRAASPRAQSPPPPGAEPTPLDNLLAVAELEFHQQRGSELLELDAAGALHAFLPAGDARVMSFDLGEAKPPDDMFYEAGKDGARDEHFPAELGAHKDLFETISEAHYLPELGGPHDEALLDSLVEKGCEDNHILGQALAQLVHAAPDYAEEEDDMLLGAAPVADIIHRLEHELGSPARASMSAAQGLLHLQHPPDQPRPDFRDAPDQTLQASADILYTESVPDSNETCHNQFQELPPETLTDGCEAPAPSEAPDNNNTSIEDNEPSHKHADTDDCMEPCIEPISPAEVDEPPEMMHVSPKREDSSEPTDLSLKHVESVAPELIESAAETTNSNEDNLSEKSDEQPKDLSLHRRLPTPHASPRRTEVPRAPSRESDAMQSPQPSGIPAVPSSPELFTMPPTKSKQTLFLESLLSSPSPKMYTSEVTITKQQCEPLNLGKHRKSASPTVTSCSDEIRKLNKEFGEPTEKKVKHESNEELVKISKLFSKCDDHMPDSRQKKVDHSMDHNLGEMCPLKQLHILKSNPEFHIPDPLLVPKDKLNTILSAPGREIPSLLIQRPELRLPEAFAFPAILQDPDILVVSLAQLESIIENDAKKTEATKQKEPKSAPPKVSSNSHADNATSSNSTTSHAESSSTPTTTTPISSSNNNNPKPIPSMDALAGDIDAANSASLNHMMWLPYMQMEALASCSQNPEVLKAFNLAGYNAPNYSDISQMLNPAARFPMGPTGFPMMPPMDYDSRLQLAMWQQAMNHAAAAAQRSKPSLEAQMKELASKAGDVQNPYVHSTKNHQNKPHSSARTSPIAHNYNSNQRSMNHNMFLQDMYAGMNPNIRPNMPLPGLQIPYFNPSLMGSQRSPRTGQQKSPTSPYYPNNNYLQSVKQSESQQQRSSSASSQESPRPRISVKSLHNLLEPSAAAASSGRRHSNSSSSSMRRREEPEVGSTTPGEPPPHPHMSQHPHDPSFHLWHPLFGNQKTYGSQWPWTQVTATGD